MAITATLGARQDPNNPNGVLYDGNTSSTISPTGSQTVDSGGSSLALPPSIQASYLGAPPPLNLQQATPEDTSSYTGAIAGLGDIFKNAYAPTQAENKGNDISSRLESLYSSLRGTGASVDSTGKIDTTGSIMLGTERAAKSLGYEGTADLENKIGASAKRIQGYINEANAIPLRTQEQFAGTGATVGGARPIETANLRRNAIAALTEKTFHDTLTGDLASAQNTASKAVELQFLPAQTELNNLMAQYNLNKDVLDREDKKRSELLKATLDERQTNLTNARDDAKTILSWAAVAKANGATDLQAQKIAAVAQSDKPDLKAAFDLYAPFTVDPNATAKALGDLEYQRAQIAKLKAETNKIYVDAKGTEGGNFDITTSVGQLASVAQNLASKYNSKFAQEQFLGNVQRLASTGDQQQLADYVFSEAISQIADTDARKRAFSNYNLVQKLETLDQATKAYVAKNGDTNIFKGSIEAIKNKVGTVGDPELAALGTTITDTLDQLARARTGAVINDSEEKLYQRLLPSTFKTAALNEATIGGLKSSLLTDLNSALKFQLTGSGFDSIEPYLAKTTGQVSSSSTSVSIPESLKTVATSKGISLTDLQDAISKFGLQATQDFINK